MKIKMLTGLSGPQYSLAPGDERRFPEDEAKRLIAAGFAAPASVEERETTAKPATPERRAKR